MKTIEEKRAYHKAWRERNPNKIKDYATKQREIMTPEGVSAYHKNWRLSNPDKIKAYEDKRDNSKTRKANPRTVRNRRLVDRYGITLSEWETLFESQGRACASCGATEEHGREKQWQTDHRHDDTRKVRGILCARCNRLIGQLGDDALSVAQSVTMFLAYLSKSGDYLSTDELEQVVQALRTSEVANLTGAASPNRPPKGRHEENR